MSHHPLYSADVSPVLLVPVEAGHSPSVNHVPFWVTFLPLSFGLCSKLRLRSQLYTLWGNRPLGALSYGGASVSLAHDHIEGKQAKEVACHAFCRFPGQ